MSAPRRTGLQREVLDLYRATLRAIRKKPEAARQHFFEHARVQFRHNAASIPKRDISTIEYFVRRGKRQLEILSDENVVDISGGRT